MSEQHVFKHKEVVEALIRFSGIKEGRWQLGLNFGISSGNIGPNSDEICPAAIVPVVGFVLMRATKDSPESLTVDASSFPLDVKVH